MDRETQEKQTSIGFRCRKILPGDAKCANECLEVIKNIESSIVDDGENCISSPTPEKPDRKLTMKEKQLRDHSSSQHILSETPLAEVALKFAELPDKFKALAELFDRMGTSIRLLGLRRRLTIFKNIRTQVELLSKRAFTYSHLAQMKYVFPEAIQLEKVLIHDEKSLCMMPDLKVKLLFDVVGSPLHPGQSTSKFLCETFCLRLLQLFQFNHANDAEIPEAMLPEPFNHRSNGEYSNPLAEELFHGIPQQTSVELDSFSSMSHFSSSFRKHFCQKVIVPEAEQTKIIASTSPSGIIHHGESRTSKNLCTILDKDSVTSLPACNSFSGAVFTPIHDLFEKTPAKGASPSPELLAELPDSPTTCVVSQSCENSPINLVKVGGDFMAETPALQTPKRPMPIATEILVNTNDKSACEPRTNPSARRTLLYSPMKMDLSKSKLDFVAVEGTNIDEHSSIDNHSNKRSSCGIDTNTTCDGASSANEKCKAMLDSLRATFDMIHHMLKSTNCSLITKQELVHKIISNNLDIEDTSEAEEQLGLLEDLLPEWMSKKSTSNGDFVYCIKHVVDAATVRSKLSNGLLAAGVEKAW